MFPERLHEEEEHFRFVLDAAVGDVHAVQLQVLLEVVLGRVQLIRVVRQLDRDQVFPENVL